jgi:hypothetical protein
VEIPGPDRVERALDAGAVDWLERREPRGEPFAWPYDFPDRILHARVVKPDPTSSFRVAVAYGEDPDWRENGRWFCLVWFWPLIPDSRSSAACTRTDVGAGVMYHGRWPSAGQFPHYVGIAADEVARMEIFYEDGWKQSVPLQDNVFSFYVAGNQSSKLVAYDSAGRVVRIDRLR